ncbi:protein CLEC16A isoform X1 [Falco biarmicus]|uniref:protein CLEC16A isoform X2 n=1 Tax=Falco rusticolus TaxID=120794 RepID=UPI0018869897|nr:protein CLEC16A isoform X2 [Falco rusticolus]XP_055563867.1 protein CLEC16A isoform X1 [Falco cherrug]XP_055660550.1 protein CLEC16A isoform X1 [Falco peregrinus]XP_056191399.1 protein CLEC16A isoform X1 [Falco biarmicus]
MFGRSRSWVGGGHGKAARSIHSLDHLKYMYHVLTKNTTVTDHNRNLLVETIRSITEILIWGDQNDSSVFDFFLEKNMFVFFLNILRQKSGRYVCVQLLQTLNILFENISHETSLYYLLSNNYVNSIIVHKFDFSDEEIMAYYISFLKTLSLKLNNHTVHFFYNEHTNDFALYTEAIKFFNHPESMVRIAVRTITLNVYKVDNQPMLHYIRDKTAVPYFSNLVWFIGSHVIELDNCVQTDEEHRNRGKLSDLVAEHLDHLHYLNDILIINCEFLNDVLTDHLLNRLFLPLYVYSLVNQDKGGERPKISLQVSLYLLSQVFLIIHYAPLVNSLAEVILNGDLSVFSSKVEQDIQKNSAKSSIRCFIKPTETLERSLEINKQKGKKRVQKRPNYKNVGEEDEEERGSEDNQDDLDKGKGTEASSKAIRTSSENEEIEMVIMERCKLSELSISTVTEQNTTDEEKSAAASGTEITNWNRPFLDMVYNALDCAEDDYYALFVLCLLYAMSHNKGIDPVKLERIQLPAQHAEERNSYNHVLAEGLIRIMNYAAQPDGKIRLATLELGCLLLKQLVFSKNGSIIKDVHLACLEGAREESVHLLRRFYKGEEIFLDMFEDEYRSMTIKPMNVEYLMMDASILLPPTGTPLTGIDFVKRLPCGDVERTRRAIRVFFMLRSLSLHLRDEPETQLPLTREEDLIKTDDVLDLNNSDLIACTVITKDGGQVQRFLAVDIYQMSLVEPDVARLGWGVVKFAGLLQDMQVTGVEDDSRALNIIIHKPASSPHSKPFPILQATFIFSDHIRCIIAKQRLAKGRIQARRMKMQRIAALLDLPVQPSTEVVMGFGHSSAATAQHLPFRFYDHSRRGSSDPTVQRSVFASVDKVPGFAVAQCINQHNPSPLSSPSPSSGSGSTGRCDSVTASSTSTPSAAQSPSGLAGKDVGGCLVCRRLTVTVDTGFRSSSSSCNRNSRNINSDDASAPEQSQMTISGQTMLTDETLSAVSKSSKNAVKNSDIEIANLSPSLIPAQQPTISLITDDNTDALSVESLTLVPPVDPHSIRTFSCIPQSSLQSEVEVCKVKEVEEECSD